MIEESVSHNKPSGYSYFVATDFSGVYAGEYPMWTWSESQGREKLAQYLNFGIRCFLDLTMPGEMPPYQPYLPADGHRYSFPIVNGGIPSDVESVVKLFQQLEKHLVETNERLYIHCVGGVGRTGTIVTCYYIYFHHLSANDALAKMRNNYASHERAAWMSAPETQSQLDYIFKFASTYQEYK